MLSSDSQMRQIAHQESVSRRSSRYHDSDYSDDISHARETSVTVAVIEPAPTKRDPIPSWVWMIGASVVIILGVVTFTLGSRPSKPQGGAIYNYEEMFPAEKEMGPCLDSEPSYQTAELTEEDRVEARKARIKTWKVKWKKTEYGPVPRKIKPGTWEKQVDRILKDFKVRYPSRHAALPFDIKEHFRWQAKYWSDHKDFGNELDLYSMLYYDWSKFSERDPLLRLLDGAELQERFAKYPERMANWKKPEEFSLSMDHVVVGDNHERAKRKPFPGSRVENRTVPQHIIEGFQAQDKTTQVAREIFEKWEGHNGGTRLCVEDCAMRIGLLASGTGKYKSILQTGHETGNHCWVYGRANYALLDELTRNDAFRNYLAWKGLRKYSASGWCTLYYNSAWGCLPNPYERLMVLMDNDITNGHNGCDGDALYSHSWNRLTAYVPNGSSKHSLPPRRQDLTDSLVIGRRKNWPRVEFPGSNF